MEPSLLTDDWPGEPAGVVVRHRDGATAVVAQFGEVDEPREWASVSKLAVALAVARDVSHGRHSYEDVVSTDGATLAHFLSHSSGWGLEVDDPRVEIATKRIYSNAGIDQAADFCATESVPRWLDDAVFGPLAMTATQLEGRAASGVIGSARDMAALATWWLSPRGISEEVDARVTSSFLPDLAGFVPGMGKFSPCPWGLGPEIHGNKAHWMGLAAPSAFGHFGQSGALCLIDRTVGLAVAVTSSVAFGPWGRQLWPGWISRVWQEYS